jgi:ribosomal protein S27AE
MDGSDLKKRVEQRRCTHCGAFLSSHNPDVLCFPCQDTKVRETPKGVSRRGFHRP